MSPSGNLSIGTSVFGTKRSPRPVPRVLGGALAFLPL
jgi:hypothetical protein